MYPSQRLLYWRSAGPSGICITGLCSAGAFPPAVGNWFGAGPPSVPRLGGCWFSHGTCGLSGVFAESWKVGSEPSIGFWLTPTSGPGSPEPGGEGVTIVLVLPPAATLTYWPL